MPLYVLDEKLWFPPVEDSLEDGLLAMGGTISVERLLLSYRSGIFPWYDGPVPMWWCPDPRFVLFPEELKVSSSMKSLLNKGSFKFTVNKAFDKVIKACKEKTRDGQDGTWITDEIEAAYNKLNKKGFAYSAEAWQGNELAGGLYGVKIGKIFFGESMFSHVSNASKFAFIKMVKHLTKTGVEIIDCQVYTSHLESLGARMIKREMFLKILHKAIA